jgi:hypothetical protein
MFKVEISVPLVQALMICPVLRQNSIHAENGLNFPSPQSDEPLWFAKTQNGRETALMRDCR